MRNRLSISQEQVSLVSFAKAMGHPTRLAILLFLSQRENCYFGNIHDELPIAKATVSQHLKELKNAGLIQGEVETPKVKYCINRENWQLAKKYFDKFISKDDLSELVTAHILREKPNVIITPHSAFNTKEAVERIIKTTYEKIEEYIKKEEINSIY